MKKLLVFLCAMLLVFGLVGISYATLIVRGYGTITSGGSGTYQLIYDDLLDITWLDYTRSYVLWPESMAWAEGLTVSFYGQTYDNWRLPQILPLNGTHYVYTHSWDGSTDSGYNISAPGTIYEGSTASELAHLYYTTLGNSGMYDVDGVEQTTFGFINTGPFNNVKTWLYWSKNIYGADPSYSWSMNYDAGHQAHGDTDRRAVAVHPGDVGAVSIPDASIILILGSSLFGLGLFSRKRKKS